MIAIPNMELPPWCGKCILQDGEICYAINENDIGSGLSFFDLEDLRNFCIKRRDDCPLIEIDLVRCKDCKYMTEHYDTDGNAPYWTCSEWDSGTDYDGFCHYGERREAMSKDIPTADILEWCKERNYALVAREDFPYLFKDIVKCEECKYREKNHYCVKWGQPYLCKDECFCSYGERRADEHNT